MTWFQWRAVLVCVVLNMIDRFDVLVMSFTAPTGLAVGVPGRRDRDLLVIGLVHFCLPESLDYLLTRHRPGVLAKINVLARRLGSNRSTVCRRRSWPAVPRPARGSPALSEAAHRRTRMVLWVAFFLVMSGFYFVTSWMPTLLVEAGLSASGGVTGGVLLNVGGMFGAVAFGALTARLRIRTVMISYLAISAVMLALFITSSRSLALLVLIGVLIGLFLNGSIGALYALTPTAYDAGVRATAMGAAIGVGRIGAILAPIAAGALLDGGWTPQALYLAVGVLILLAAVVLLGLRIAATAPQNSGGLPMRPMRVPAKPNTVRNSYA